MSESENSLLQRRVLDSQVSSGLRDDTRPWGVWPWAAPVLALLVLIVAGQLIARHVSLRGQSVVLAVALSGIIGDGLLLAVVWLCARQPARAAGGWTAAFGLDRLRLDDLAPWAIGVLVTFVGRTVVGVIANGLSHGHATRLAQNLHLHVVHGLDLDLLTLAVVIIAPIVEEIVFRGLLLRTFMRRFSFWPAACLSTALFAGFHVYEVNTVIGALTLAAGIAVLGITNCYLVRITGRLTPGILTHASFNLLANLYLVATGR